MSYTLISSVSSNCPGTSSSGPFEVVGVTNPSPSIVISSEFNPVAVPYARLPPVTTLSNVSVSGKKLPSLVDFLIIIVSPSFSPKGKLSPSLSR